MKDNWDILQEDSMEKNTL